MRAAYARGFTLIEIMVVVVLAGVVLAMISVSAFPDDRSKLRTEADRLAQLWTIAHDEAQVRGAPIVWEANEQSYRFYVREGQRLEPMERDVALRERRWELTPMRVVEIAAPDGRSGPPVRVAFERAGADPVAVELDYGKARAIVRGDGLGRFEVEMP
ncbi:MAG TPA: prepilin-type N-terminal cleavage/methylation domain-containing protein [Burkholderiaceae bacterium]|nr:prepilin-type N-terminal cleavage/methylation domain-containing protein [Burkholderiaceae bacterium]